MAYLNVSVDWKKNYIFQFDLELHLHQIVTTKATKTEHTLYPDWWLAECFDQLRLYPLI